MKFVENIIDVNDREHLVKADDGDSDSDEEPSDEVIEQKYVEDVKKGIEIALDNLGIGAKA